MFGKCLAKEIGGEKITVRKNGLAFRLSQFLKSLFNQEERLETDTIEGDEIDLEFTTAKAVRGNRVVIGRGCDIGTVEYKTEFRLEKDGKVGEKRQI
jgi:cytoskeletal protein CcmA (bactofilin family)